MSAVDGGPYGLASVGAPHARKNGAPTEGRPYNFVKGQEGRPTMTDEYSPI